ncbi:hypothetical protein [Vallitalea guaymasensis]|uniref:Uncharacterized protein n=1 Tax=Vallitalea guaymasensis TaxID=1185412 RepID=A0A8J8M7G8_9FIRM|nr:hypothetical protein [Vallitalea guaymasensis]QUH27792.1 hypothetical protein HYG85_02220 [Vallitalea guaymasensis]
MIELEGNIVEEYKIGNTKVQIRDSGYINRTPEDIQKILDNISTIILNHYIREQNKVE